MDEPACVGASGLAQLGQVAHNYRRCQMEAVLPRNRQPFGRFTGGSFFASIPRIGGTMGYITSVTSVEVSAIPEPATGLLGGLSLATLAQMRQDTFRGVPLAVISPKDLAEGGAG